MMRLLHAIHTSRPLALPILCHSILIPGSRMTATTLRITLNADRRPAGRSQPRTYPPLSPYHSRLARTRCINPIPLCRCYTAVLAFCSSCIIFIPSVHTLMNWVVVVSLLHTVQCPSALPGPARQAAVSLLSRCWHTIDPELQQVSVRVLSIETSNGSAS